MRGNEDRDQASGKEQETQDVDAAYLPGAFGPRWQQEQCRDQGDDADWQVDDENQAPAVGVAERLNE